MREIKFRGKSIFDYETSNDHIEASDWVYGHYYFCRQRMSAIIVIQMECESGGVGSGLCQIEVEVDPKTVGQYTGLKDKEGVEIWEGDLLKIILPEIINEGQSGGLYEPSIPEEMVSPEKILIAEVKTTPITGVRAIVRKISFPNNDWGDEEENKWIVTKCAKIGSKIKPRKTDKVIGNIHDNPELLEGVIE